MSLLDLPPCPERDCNWCGEPTRGVGFEWWDKARGCNRCRPGEEPPPPRSDSAEVPS